MRIIPSFGDHGCANHDGGQAIGDLNPRSRMNAPMTGAAALGNLVVKTRILGIVIGGFGGRECRLSTDYVSSRPYLRPPVRWPAKCLVYGLPRIAMARPGRNFRAVIARINGTRVSVDRALRFKSYGFTAAILYGLAIMVARMLLHANGEYSLMRRRCPRRCSYRPISVASDFRSTASHSYTFNSKFCNATCALRRSTAPRGPQCEPGIVEVSTARRR